MNHLVLGQAIKPIKKIMIEPGTMIEIKIAVMKKVVIMSEIGINTTKETKIMIGIGTMIGTIMIGINTITETRTTIGIGTPIRTGHGRDSTIKVHGTDRRNIP